MASNPNQFRTAAVAGRAVDQAQLDEGLRKYMLSVYNYMATGLAISGLVAWVVANIPAVTQIFFNVAPLESIPAPLHSQFITVGSFAVGGPNALGMIAMFAPLVMLFGAMFLMRQPRAGTAQAFYWAFVAINGIGLSVILLAYTGESVMRTFLITAAAFAGLSIFGYTTKKNLSGLGSFLIMGLIGLLLAMVVNIFLASDMLQFIISVAGVLIFAGLVAFDTQRIKNTYSDNMGHDAETVTAVFGALSLYINFINLFQFLMMFLGQRE